MDIPLATIPGQIKPALSGLAWWNACGPTYDASYRFKVRRCPESDQVFRISLFLPVRLEEGNRAYASIPITPTSVLPRSRQPRRS